MRLRTWLPMLLVLSSTTVCAETVFTGDLPRSADLGFSPRVVSDEAGARLVVTRLVEDSAAAAAGLQADDVITAVDGAEAAPVRLRSTLRRANGNTPLALSVLRDGDRRFVRYTAPALPAKSVEGFDIEMGVVDTRDGARLRTMLALPVGSSGRMPTIFFTQWVSCGSIVRYFGSRGDGVLDAIGRELGVAIALVERASDGDSEGPDCDRLDYDTELAHYREAFDVMTAHPRVDSDRVLIVGSSLGSTTAPLLAQAVQAVGGKVAGVAVQGGGALTYVERMIRFDRAYLERRPSVAPVAIHDEMMQRIRFHTEYLIGQRSPNAIAGDSDAMAAVRADIRGMGDNDHYGRPFAWHQQAAQRNFLGAWAAIDAPVLVAFTEFDQFESEHGHRVIVDMVNRLRPGTATWVLLSGLGHSNWRFDTAMDAYADQTGAYEPAPLRAALTTWMREVLE